jgi:hypothetical protein
MKENRVVILVSGGVAEYISDPSVSALLIDLDNIEAGDVLTSADVEGFEDLIPDGVIPKTEHKAFIDLIANYQLPKY